MANVERFSALQYRNFRLFWFGQIISLSGNMDAVRCTRVACLQFDKITFLFRPRCGIRSAPDTLVHLCRRHRCGQVQEEEFTLDDPGVIDPARTHSGHLTDIKMIAVWQVALLAALLGTVNAFDIPARQSFIVELVGKSKLTNAIALNSAAFHGARIIGPVIAGLTISSLGLPACFYLNAASFIAVIVALSKINIKGDIYESSNGFMQDFIEGIKYIKSNDGDIQDHNPYRRIQSFRNAFYNASSNICR